MIYVDEFIDPIDSKYQSDWLNYDILSQHSVWRHLERRDRRFYFWHKQEREVVVGRKMFLKCEILRKATVVSSGHENIKRLHHFLMLWISKDISDEFSARLETRWPLINNSNWRMWNVALKVAPWRHSFDLIGSFNALIVHQELDFIRRLIALSSFTLRCLESWSKASRRYA